jgi:acyl dehydratase
MKPLDFESADKGSPLETLSVPALTRMTLARFAGASDDYNPMHLDDKIAAAAGKASVFAPSHLIMAYVGRLVESAFQGVSIRRYGLRMLKLLWPGDVMTCRGVVVDKRVESGEHMLDVDVWADNQRGETVAKGRVLAVVPAKKGASLSRTALATGLVYPISSGAKGRGKRG